MIEITNEDNMLLMARYTDKDFDLGSFDPPYGIKASRPSKKPNKKKQKNGRILKVKTVEYSHKNWDDKPADSVFGKEAMRVSKNYMFWGANHFDWIVDETFKPPRRKDFKKFIIEHPVGWIIWDKLNGGSDQWDCELIFTSYQFNSTIIPFMWSGMMQGNIENGSKMQGNKKLNEIRYHTTQKPVRIYEKVYRFLSLIDSFKTIIDTGIGSGSNAIACHNLQYDLTACELDKDYYEDAMKRLEQHRRQLRLFRE